MHYWAGRAYRNEFANTLEDVVNIILKVSALNAAPMHLLILQSHTAQVTDTKVAIMQTEGDR